MIERLRLRNFRSFKDVDIELRPLNIVVGANASGKTNLVQAFRFLRDLAQHGLENAVSLQGGVEYLRNLQADDRRVFIAFDFTAPATLPPPDLFGDANVTQTRRVHYELLLRVYDSTRSVAIQRETLRFEVVAVQKGKLEQGQIQMEREGGWVRLSADEPFRDRLLWLPFLPFEARHRRKRFRFDPKIALIQLPVGLLPAPFFFHETVEIYDFLPRLAKQPAPIGSPLRLSERGENLPVALQHILSHPVERERLLKLTQLVLPHIRDLQTTPSGQHLLLQVGEKFHRKPLPAALLSDGTVEVVALLVALFFSGQVGKTLVFEEPDRHLHPALLSAILSLFQDATELNQILITTHNPELVRRAELDWLLLIERDREGNSVIKRPADSERVKIFIEEQLELDYLHVNQMLGV